MKTILITNPHGAQTLNIVEGAETYRTALFCLSDDAGHALTLTGEELDSLTKQWQQARNAPDLPFNVPYCRSVSS
jgi:hypothetical protein